MKRVIHPGVLTAVLTIIALVIGWAYYRGTEPPPPMPMNPLGPGAAYLRQHPEALAKMMNAHGQSAPAGKGGPAGVRFPPPN